jgi:hypothetical protein
LLLCPVPWDTLLSSLGDITQGVHICISQPYVSVRMST